MFNQNVIIDPLMNRLLSGDICQTSPIDLIRLLYWI